VVDHLPAIAADRPSMTIAMEKMMPTAVKLESKCSTRSVL